MKNDRKVRDARIQNSRGLRQQRLDRIQTNSNDEDLGDCGSFGERLYDEGTELCDFCPLSNTCFAMYKHWRNEQ